MQAIILSGGKGTRLRPLTYHTPKPMLDVAGRPHLEHQVALLREHGITNIIFSTGYLHEEIVNHFGDGTKFGVKIQYRQDGNKELGTAGAIKNCEDLIESDTLIILNGDILTNINLSQLIEEHQSRKMCPITIALTKVSDPSRYGVALIKNDLIERFIEKPDTFISNLINSGMYVINREVLNFIAKDEFCMLEKDVFPQYAKSKLIAPYVSDYYWIDIGTVQTYLQVHEDIYRGKLNVTTKEKLTFRFFKERDEEFIVGTWWGKLGNEVTFTNVSYLTKLIAEYAQSHGIHEIAILPDGSEYTYDLGNIMADVLDDNGIDIAYLEVGSEDRPAIRIAGGKGEEDRGYVSISVVTTEQQLGMINRLKRKTIKK